jgi:hypothetical protein
MTERREAPIATGGYTRIVAGYKNQDNGVEAIWVGTHRRHPQASGKCLAQKKYRLHAMSAEFAGQLQAREAWGLTHQPQQSNKFQ